MTHAGRAVKAKYGERMIEVRVKFFTNEIDSREGYIVPKHAWPNGTVQMKANNSHGIVPAGVRHFGSLMEIPLAIEKLLVDHEINIHRARRLFDYIV